jgi:AcrR family transcriptional regulator
LKRALLKAATKLFAENGYEKVSIKAIAEEAGVTSGMIAYYFGGKGGLYREVLHSLFLAYEKRLPRLMEKDKGCRELMKEYFETAHRIYEDNPYYSMIICREGSNPTGEFKALLREHEQRMGGDYLRHLVQHCIDSGAMRSDVPPGVLARLLSLTANYFRIPMSLHDILHPHEEFNLQAYFNLLGDLFFTGLEKRD